MREEGVRVFVRVISRKDHHHRRKTLAEGERMKRRAEVLVRVRAEQLLKISHRIIELGQKEAFLDLGITAGNGIKFQRRRLITVFPLDRVRVSFPRPKRKREQWNGLRHLVFRYYSLFILRRRFLAESNS